MKEPMRPEELPEIHPEISPIVLIQLPLDSSIAYQGYGRRLGEPVTIINGYAIADCIPDLTLLLKLDPRVGKHRIKGGRFSATL